LPKLSPDAGGFPSLAANVKLRCPFFHHL